MVILLRGHALFACAVTCSAVLAQPGSIDVTFNPGGAGFSSDWGPGLAHAIALQPDGKILVSGSEYYNGQACKAIIRLNSDGSLDPSFDLDPSITGGPGHLLLRPDGKLLAQNGSVVVLLNADGTVDTTFDPQLGTCSNVSGMALQPDGKILLTSTGGGSFGNEPGKLLVRLEADGTQDTSFQQDGWSSGFHTLKLADDGRIYVGGNVAIEVNGQNVLFSGFARFLADGTLDTTFVAEGGPDFLGDMLIQPDGKILTGSSPAFRRYLQDGSVDPDYAPTTMSGFDPWVMAIVPQPAGGALVAGRFTHCNGIPTGRIARMNSDGTLDASFQTTGLGISGWSLELSALAVQPDGKILVGGYFDSFDGNAVGGLVRLEACLPGEPCGQALSEDGALEPAGAEARLFPNPYSAGPLSLAYPGPEGSVGSVTIRIFDPLGQLVGTGIQEVSRSHGSLTFQPGSMLASGIYSVVVVIDGDRSVHRLVVR